VAHRNGCNYGSDIGELCVVIKWPTQIGATSGAIL
jgi:hypothetical protein